VPQIPLPKCPLLGRSQGHRKITASKQKYIQNHETIYCRNIPVVPQGTLSGASHLFKRLLAPSVPLTVFLISEGEGFEALEALDWSDKAVPSIESDSGARAIRFSPLLSLSVPRISNVLFCVKMTTSQVVLNRLHVILLHTDYTMSSKSLFGTILPADLLLS